MSWALAVLMLQTALACVPVPPGWLTPTPGGSSACGPTVSPLQPGCPPDPKCQGPLPTFQPALCSCLPPQAVEKLVQGAESGCHSEKEKQIILNCSRLLTRVLPYIFEDPDWRGFFWSTVPGAGRGGVCGPGQGWVGGRVGVTGRAPFRAGHAPPSLFWDLGSAGVGPVGAAEDGVHATSLGPQFPSHGGFCVHSLEEVGYGEKLRARGHWAEVGAEELGSLRAGEGPYCPLSPTPPALGLSLGEVPRDATQRFLAGLRLLMLGVAARSPPVGRGVSLVVPGQAPCSAPLLPWEVWGNQESTSCPFILLPMGACLGSAPVLHHPASPGPPLPGQLSLRQPVGAVSSAGRRGR